jgi:hypothetical protein
MRRTGPSLKGRGFDAIPANGVPRTFALVGLDGLDGLDGNLTLSVVQPQSSPALKEQQQQHGRVDHVKAAVAVEERYRACGQKTRAAVVVVHSP